MNGSRGEQHETVNQTARRDVDSAPVAAVRSRHSGGRGRPGGFGRRPGAVGHAQRQLRGLEPTARWTRIDADNVAQLTMAWTMQLGIHDSYESSPLVIGDTMYIVTPKPNYVYALDLARQGFIKWEFRPEIPDPERTQRSACCGAQTRGITLRRRPDLLRHPRRTGVRSRRGDRRADSGRPRTRTSESGETVPGMPLVVGRQGHRRRGRRRARRPRPRHPPTAPTPAGSGGGTTAWGRTTRVGIGSRFRALLSGRPRREPGARHLVRRLVAARRRLRLGLVHIRRRAQSLLLRHEQLRPVESGLPAGVGRGRAGRGRGPDRPTGTTTARRSWPATPTAESSSGPTT